MFKFFIINQTNTQQIHIFQFFPVLLERYFTSISFLSRFRYYQMRAKAELQPNKPAKSVAILNKIPEFCSKFLTNEKNTPP